MKKIKYMLLILIVPIVAFFGFTNVKADIYIENGYYMFDFNDDIYDNDYDMLDSLTFDLINYFEIDNDKDVLITETNFINTNFDTLYLTVVNGKYNSVSEKFIYGFEILGLTSDYNEYEFLYYIVDGVSDIAHIGLGDYYVYFDFLYFVNEPEPEPEPFISHFTKIFDFLITPFTDILERLGIQDTPIKVGFGKIEWFNIQLYDLTYLTLSFIVLYLFFRLIYKIIKKFVKIITGGAL